MDSDEEEALRCIRIAKEAIAAGDKQKALKFLGMAHCLNKYLRLDNLFAACENLDSWSSCRPTHDAKNATNVKAEKASANGSWFSKGEKSNTADKASANGGWFSEGEKSYTADKASANGGWFSKGEKSYTADKASANGGWFSKGEKSDTKDHKRLVKEIISEKDYYAILGVERNCSVDDIKKAYRKLSLKVHPDKNKAPGAEEAFKKVSVAFKCLSDNESRKQYDQMGSGNEFEHHYQQNPFEHNQQDPFRRRRRRTWNEYFNDDVEPEELRRQFFGHNYAFREAHFCRTRTNHAPAPAHQRKDSRNGLPNTVWWLPLLIFILFASFMFMVPEYSSNRGFSHQIRKTTENYGIDYFVKSPQFDMKYPMGSPGRTQIENNVINEHRLKLERACDRETSWIPPHRRHYTPRPHCEILESFMA